MTLIEKIAESNPEWYGMDSEDIINTILENNFIANTDMLEAISFIFNADSFSSFSFIEDFDKRVNLFFNQEID